MRTHFALALLVVLSGCIRLAPDAARVSPTSDRVTLSAEQRRTDMVLLRLTNGSDMPIGYNLCTTVIEREEESWIALPSDVVCTMELRTLAPGASATFERQLTPSVSPGEYRFRAAVESPLGTRQIGVVSNAVSIR